MGVRVLAKANKQALVYTIHDDSINSYDSDLDKYVESHDVKYLSFEPIDEENDQFGPTEFWCQMPTWDEAEPIFWKCLGNTRKMAFEFFRIYVKEFKNFRWRNEKNEIDTLFCAMVREPEYGMVIRNEVLELIPRAVQQDVGAAVMLLSGVMDKALKLTQKLNNEFDQFKKVVPGEIEKNSSASVSKTGSIENKSGADAASNSPISESV